MLSKRFWAIGLAVFCLFALVCGSLKAAEKKVVFQDDFNTLNQDNWEIGNPENFVVKNGVLSIKPGSQYRVTSYDLFKYGEMEIKVRFPLAFRDGAFYYFGFMSRKPWGKNCVMVATGSKTGNLDLWVGKEGVPAAVNQPVGTLVQNTWHVLKFVWKPDRAEFFLDGKSCGYTDKKECIPDTDLPIILDTFSDPPGDTSFEIDYIKVYGTE